MRLIVTRPLDDAIATKLWLERLGHEVCLSPVASIRATRLLPPVQDYDACLVTSANAFRCAVPALLDRVKLIPAFVVGERTAERGREAGLSRLMSAQGDQKALASLICQKLTAGMRLLYLAGRDRKPELEKALNDAGFAVDVIETYFVEPATELSPAARDLISTGRADCVLHYSHNSAARFVALAEAAGMGEALGGLWHHCISEDAARPLRLARLPKIAIASRPNEDSLIAVLSA